MLTNAMDAYQLAKRVHNENVKAQYTDKQADNDGAVTYFRASGLGDADRKQIYKFFAHRFPTNPKTAQNLRQLENGDKVHERYQDAWEEMGILISMEDRLSSKDDEYLGQFEWELAGHYDGLLDVNIMRAHALGLVKVGSYFNEETAKWEIEVELDEAYANSIGIYDEDGNYSEDYEPLTMVADIKTMNPWGFKKIKENADVSNIGGYIDQIMKYMYDLNTPYGSIFIEAKDNNATVEVQVLWKDLHDGIEYTWDETIHGVLDGEKVRVVVDMERFFGSETVEGIVPRLTRLWELKKALEEADEAGDIAKMREIFPQRCADKADAFPCSWGHKTGKPAYCDFYDHCWNSKTGGVGIKPYEDVPAEFVWEFNDDETGKLIRVDNRLVPEGIGQDQFAGLVQMGALVLEKFIIADEEEILTVEELDEITVFDEDAIFSAGGELVLTAPPLPARLEGAPSEADEYLNDHGKKAIDCLKCGKQITYQKLGNGGTKKCPHCKHTNEVGSRVG